MGRTIHIGIEGRPIDISDSEAEALIKDGVLYECGDGHDLHIDPDASADVEDLERLLTGIALAASAEPISLDGDDGFHTLDVEDKVYRVGDMTMRRVFEPAGLRNMSDMQAVMDAVEKALKEPAGGEVKGLPVAGYKPTQSQDAIDLVNEGKILEERVLRWVDRVKKENSMKMGNSIGFDLSIDGMLQIQVGFMLLYRAVFQPNGSRIKLPEDEA